MASIPSLSDEAIIELGPAMAPFFENAAKVMPGRRAELARGMADALRSCDPEAVRAAAKAVSDACGGDDE